MAILTIGYGKTYSTITAAVAASGSGDTLEVYSQTADSTKMCGWGSSTDANLTGADNLTIIAKNPSTIHTGASTTWNSVVGGVRIENFVFTFTNRLFNQDANVTFTFVNCFTYTLYTGSFFLSSASGVCNWYNCAFYSTVFSCLRCSGGISNVYNCTFVQSSYGGYNDYAIYLISGTLNIYNCKIFGGTHAIIKGGGTLNEDYNEVSHSVGGSNDVVRTTGEMGFSLGSFYGISLRIDQSYELAGTTNANGTDLTALYTTDIDGRARSTYARGCSEGFKEYSQLDFPAESDVRLGVDYDRGRLTGDVTLPTEADVKLDVTYDSLLSRTGIYDPPTSPIYAISSDGAVAGVVASDSALVGIVREV